MLFPAIKRWRCYLQQQQLQLWVGQQHYAQCRWQPEQPLAEQLTSLLQRIPPAPAWFAALEFVVDTPHVSYLLAPWCEGLSRPAELRQYAALLLAQQQDRQPAMTVSLLHSSYGEPAFAALLERQLLVTLRQCAAAQRLRFAGCCTPFSDLLTRFRHKLPASALFASIGEQESSFACRYQQRWHSIFTLRLPCCDLSHQLETANRLAALPPLPHFVCRNMADIRGFVREKGVAV